MKNSNKNGYEVARGNLLAVILFTVLNVVFIFLESDTMFLFSATIPYFCASIGYWWGLYGYFVVTGVVLLIYLACWYFSKKHKAWLIVALVMFIIDTIFMLWAYGFEFDTSMIVDLVFHIWVLFYLVGGVMYRGNNQKNIEKNDFVVDEMNSFQKKDFVFDEQKDIEKVENSSYLRLADDVKARIFLEEDILGKHVVYRRVNTINELVINGKVYDEYEALVERPHALRANINGHLIEAGISGTSQMYLSVDGEVIKKKMRWI